MRTDADTRQATLDAAAIRNFIGIFVARGPQFAARPAQQAARRPRAQAACSGAWCAPARPCGPRRMRSGPGGTSRVSQYVLLPKTAGRQHRGFAGQGATARSRARRGSFWRPTWSGGSNSVSRQGGRQVRAHGRVGAVALVGAVLEAVRRGGQAESLAFRAHLTREPTEPRGSVRRRCADDSGRLAVARSPMAARKDAPRYSPNRVIGAKKWSDGGDGLVSRDMFFGATVPTTYPEKPGIRGPEPVRRRPPRTRNVRGGPTRFRRRPGRFACGLFEAT